MYFTTKFDGYASHSGWLLLLLIQETTTIKDATVASSTYHAATNHWYICNLTIIIAMIKSWLKKCKVQAGWRSTTALHCTLPTTQADQVKFVASRISFAMLLPTYSAKRSASTTEITAAVITTRGNVVDKNAYFSIISGLQLILLVYWKLHTPQDSLSMKHCRSCATCTRDRHFFSSMSLALT